LYKTIITIIDLIVKPNQLYYKKRVITATAKSPDAPVKLTISVESALKGIKLTPKKDSRAKVVALASEFSAIRKKPLVLSEKTTAKVPSAKRLIKTVKIVMVKNMPI
jgi:hypothetical protein